MKKMIGLILAVIILFMSVALAEDLSAMTDAELKALLLDVYEELQSRGFNYIRSTVVSVPEDEALADRITEFYIRWSANDLDGMLELCDPAWKAEQENLKTALFAILANRTPLVFAVEAPCGETDGTGTAVVTARIDRHNGMDPLDYIHNIVMRKASDGLWYMDPRCLLTYEPVYADKQEEPTPEPAVSVSSAGEDMPDALLFYVPEGGEYYHLDDNCRRVAEKYLPMTGVFSFHELNYDEYKDLKPCGVCGAPSRDDAPAPAGFFLKIYDNSGLENVSCLRADICVGDRSLGFICSCPDPGEDYYRFPIEASAQEDLKDMRVELFYVVSGLAPEEAVLAVMAEPSAVEEHKLTALDFIPEAGATCVLSLEADGAGGFTLTPAE